jgi:hypothetical protein
MVKKIDHLIFEHQGFEDFASQPAFLWLESSFALLID